MLEYVLQVVCIVSRYGAYGHNEVLEERKGSELEISAHFEVPGFNGYICV